MTVESQTRRTIGTTGLVVTLVGLVIGISIFILPGALAAQTGPAVVVSYALAGAMAFFSCVVAAQIGTVFPVSGAGFISISRLLSPFWGFTTVWLMIGGAAVAIALLAYGFADYMIALWHGAPRTLLAVLLVLGLALLNLTGVKDTVRGQAIMVAVFLTALAVFGLVGAFAVEPSNLTPFFPNGLPPVIAAVVPAFFSFAGFAAVIEIGGEIRNPSRTIPRALGISFAIVLIVYMVIATVLVGVIPWQELGGMTAPVAQASARFLPAWLATVIALTAVAAAASSVNVLLLSYSRDVLALAQVKVLPDVFGTISKKHGEPVFGVMLMTVLALLAVSIGGDIGSVATLVAVALLATQLGLGVVVLRIPMHMQSTYDTAEFRLNKGVLYTFGGGLIVLSAGFLLLTILEDPRIMGIAFAYAAVGWFYYVLRKRALSKVGVHIDAEISQLASGS